ncbi:Ribosome biogenesis protein BOP [Ananas comosus]|uniref:Ribosome biogenesis protein BOP1 homolog n=1 Tax=Ananas comosus TaxID=4615 RepID=A0A199W279_ANACO|nr:Ribosome biogenesis protein BOP [Ananas comosus]
MKKEIPAEPLSDESKRSDSTDPSEDEELSSYYGEDGEENGESGGESDSSEDEVSSLDDAEDRGTNGDVIKSVEESDSSEDEVAPRNTIGEVPLEWYRDEEHVGYDVSGKKIKKQARKDKIESFLAGADNVYDEYNDEEVELTKEEIKVISRLLRGKTPHAGVDPYAPYVDWFVWEDKAHPLSSAPEPKRRFIRSKWEDKKVVRLVRAIRKGWIKFDKPKEESQFHLLWTDDSNAADNKRHGVNYIAAPKPKLPGHEESYNPSIEYVPTEEEKNAYQLMYEEDRPKFIPRRFESLRSVPAYDMAVKEVFDRCLDLYLCPRSRKKRLNIDPESLKPKLPSRKDLRPYPTTCYLEYRGHTGPVKSLSVEISGQWLASGSTDGTVRVWEVETGRCLKVWDVGESVQHVAWNPSQERPILAVALGHDVLLLNTGLGDAEVQMRIKELLHVEESKSSEDTGDHGSAVRWFRHDKYDGIILKHFKSVSTVEWHSKGDYFATGIPVSVAFHQKKKIFFVATKKFVRVYDLESQRMIKKLETGCREVSSISLHSTGDHVIVGSREGKMCWFDLDYSSKPYKTLKIHQKDITSVSFHRTYPLFASCSDDCTAYVFHGMVYSDLNQDPLIVPLEILHGHTRSDGRGVLCCKFHPRQPWLFTAGADSVIKLYCD